MSLTPLYEVKDPSTGTTSVCGSYHIALIESELAKLRGAAARVYGELAADPNLIGEPCPDFDNMTYADVVAKLARVQQDPTHAIPIGTWMLFSDDPITENYTEVVFGQLLEYAPSVHGFPFRCYDEQNDDGGIYYAHALAIEVLLSGTM